MAATASCVKAMAPIAQITAGRDAAQTALTAGTLKRSAERLLRYSTRADLPRLIFIKPEQHCERRPSMRL